MVTGTMEGELTAQLMTQVEFVDAPGMKGKTLDVGKPDSIAVVIGTAQVTDANGKAMPGTGYVKVYDTLSREPSTIPYMMLERQLEIKREDGSRVFTTLKPKEPPIRGTLLCPLHPNAPRRAEFDRIGLPKCRKATLMTELDQQRHLKACHARAYQYIERTRLEGEKQEDRAFQRMMMETMAQVVKERPQAPHPTGVSVGSVACTEPGCTFTATSKFGLAAHRRHRHKPISGA